MILYLGSSFQFIDIVDRISNLLEIDNFEIIGKWWKRIFEVEGLGHKKTTELKKLYLNLDPNDFYSKPETKKSYLIDLENIEKADAFILIAPKKASRSDFIGANIELGYALALGKPCLSVGDLNNSTMYFDVKKCKTYIDLLNELKLMEWDRK